MKGIVSLTLTAACLLALISCSKGSVPTTPDSLTPYRQATIFTDAEVIFEGTNVSAGYHDIDLATIQHVTGADPALLDFNAAAVTIERADFNSNGIIGKVRFRWLDSTATPAIGTPSDIQFATGLDETDAGENDSEHRRPKCVAGGSAGLIRIISYPRGSLAFPVFSEPTSGG